MGGSISRARNIMLIIALTVIAYKASYHRAGFSASLCVRSFPRDHPPSLRILSANVQRLPYLIDRPAPAVGTMLLDHDIVCLQEDFQPWETRNKIADSHGVSHCFPAGSWSTLLNSGLSVWSRVPLRFISFERFQNLRSIDRLADKGFLAVGVGPNLILVNTHLQATYDYRNLHYDVAHEQVRQIRTWLQRNYPARPSLIVGDFNYDLRAHGATQDGWRIVVPAGPTHWSRMESWISETSSAVPRHGFFPLTCDGAMLGHESLSVAAESVVASRLDSYTDHLAVSFSLQVR